MKPVQEGRPMLTNFPPDLLVFYCWTLLKSSAGKLTKMSQHGAVDPFQLVSFPSLNLSSECLPTTSIVWRCTWRPHNQVHISSAVSAKPLWVRFLVVWMYKRWSQLGQKWSWQSTIEKGQCNSGERVCETVMHCKHRLTLLSNKQTVKMAWTEQILQLSNLAIFYFEFLKPVQINMQFSTKLVTSLKW